MGYPRAGSNPARSVTVLRNLDFFVQKGHVAKVLAVLLSFKSAFNELDQAILQDLPADVTDAVILWVF